MFRALRYNSSAGSKKAQPFTVPPTSKIFENSSLNPNLFRITTAMAGMQFALWCYLSFFALTQLKPVQEMKREQGEVTPTEDKLEKEKLEKDEGKSSGSRYDMFGWVMSSKWRLSLSLLSLGAGTMFALMAYVYPLRLVRAMTYVRPTQSLAIVTHSPWGFSRNIEVPLVNVTCNTTPDQIEQGQSIALKIENFSLFFMLNHKGTDIDPMLSLLVLSRRTR